MSRVIWMSAVGLLFATGCSSSSDASPASHGAAGAGAAGNAQAGAPAAAGSVGSSGAASGGSSAGGVGSSGSSSSSGSSGAGTGGISPCSTPGLVLCDDFENDALGAQPTGSPWAASNCFDSSHTLKVDDAQASSGSHSLVSQGIPYADCQLHADLGTLTDFYVRANVFYAPGAADQFEAHEVSVFELVPAASTDDPSIRVGFRGNTCLPEGVELNITGGMEQTGCTGKAPAAGVWTCYELHVKASDTGITADLSIDGVDQSYSNHGSPQLQIVNPDLKSVRYLRLGARSYSGSYAPLIYVDDIAVGTQPIGCSAPR